MADHATIARVLPAEYVDYMSKRFGKMNRKTEYYWQCVECELRSLVNIIGEKRRDWTTDDIVQALRRTDLIFLKDLSAMLSAQLAIGKSLRKGVYAAARASESIEASLPDGTRVVFEPKIETSKLSPTRVQARASVHVYKKEDSNNG